MITFIDGENRVVDISQFVLKFLEANKKPIFWGTLSLMPEEVADPNKGLPVVLAYGIQIVQRTRAQAALEWFRGLAIEDVPENSPETLAGLRLCGQPDDHHDLPPLAPLLHIIQEAFHQALTPHNTYDLSRFASLAQSADPIIPQADMPAMEESNRIH